jgi:hypothetical protein
MATPRTLNVYGIFQVISILKQESNFQRYFKHILTLQQQHTMKSDVILKWIFWQNLYNCFDLVILP